MLQTSRNTTTSLHALGKRQVGGLIPLPVEPSCVYLTTGQGGIQQEVGGSLWVAGAGSRQVGECRRGGMLQEDPRAAPWPWP